MIAATAASCQGKRKFDKWLEAAKNAKYVHRFTDADMVMPYHCKQCGGWHVGTAIGARRKKTKMKERYV